MRYWLDTEFIEDGKTIDLIEVLSERVHAAWMAEKQRQGFADHVVKPSSRGLTWSCSAVIEEHGGLRVCEFPYEYHHADMLPYADLAEHVKEYDRATVRGVLAALEEAGYVVVKVEPMED